MKEEYLSADVKDTLYFADRYLDKLDAQKIKLQHLEPFQKSEDLYLCHRTNFFPKSGYVYPRTFIILSEIYKDVIGVEKEIYNIIGDYLSLTRCTIHFSLNHIVLDNIGAMSRNHCGILIVSPFNKSKHKIIGGYIEDLMIFGPWRIPEGSYILIPNSDRKKYLDDLNQFPKDIKIIYYNGSLSNAYKIFCDENKIPVMDLDGLVDDIDVNEVFCGKLSGKAVFSDELAKNMDYFFCTHEATILRSAEKAIRNFFDYRGKYLSPELPMSDLNMSQYNSLLNFLVPLFYNAEKLYVDKIDSLIFDSFKNSIFKGMHTLVNNADINLRREWRRVSLAITHYDKVSLARPFLYQSSSCNSLNITSGLYFGLYFYGNEYDVLLNGICVIGKDNFSQAISYASKLRSIYNLPFESTELEGKACIVLRNINYPEVGKAIHDKVNSRSR